MTLNRFKFLIILIILPICSPFMSGYSLNPYRSIELNTYVTPPPIVCESCIINPSLNSYIRYSSNSSNRLYKYNRIQSITELYATNNDQFMSENNGEAREERGGEEGGECCSSD